MDYVLANKIGEGSFGMVYKANKVNDENQKFAVKKFRRSLSESSLDDYTILDITIPVYLNHKNLMKIEKFFIHHDKLHLVMSCHGRDLLDWIKGSDRMKPENVKKVFYQITDGLHYMHINGCLHRDLKTRNILIDDNFEIKIIDFGSVKYIGNSPRCLEHEVQTLWYRSPEVLLGQKDYDYKIDIWSLGCIIIEILLQRSPFPGDSEIDQIFKIFRQFGTPDEETWKGFTSLPYYKPSFPNWKSQGFTGLLNPETDTDIDTDKELIDLMTGIMQLDPSKRFDCRDVLMHQYFNGVNEYELPKIDNYYHVCNRQSILKKEKCVAIDFFKQKDINVKMVNILHDWLLDVHDNYKLMNCSLFLAFQIFNRFMSKITDIKRADLQLVGIACLSIAGKIHEIYSIDYDDLSFICDHVYSEDQIKNMELKVLEVLEGDLIEPTPYEVLKSITHSKLGQQDLLVMTIIKACIYNQLYHKYKPSILTKAAIQISCVILRKLGQISDITLEPQIEESENIQDVIAEILECLRTGYNEKRKVCISLDKTSYLIKDYFES